MFIPFLVLFSEKYMIIHIFINTDKNKSKMQKIVKEKTEKGSQKEKRAKMLEKMRQNGEERSLY